MISKARQRWETKRNKQATLSSWLQNVEVNKGYIEQMKQTSLTREEMDQSIVIICVLESFIK